MLSKQGVSGQGNTPDVRVAARLSRLVSQEADNLHAQINWLICSHRLLLPLITDLGETIRTISTKNILTKTKQRLGDFLDARGLKAVRGVWQGASWVTVNETTTLLPPLAAHANLTAQSMMDVLRDQSAKRFLKHQRERDCSWYTTVDSSIGASWFFNMSCY